MQALQPHLYLFTLVVNWAVLIDNAKCTRSHCLDTQIPDANDGTNINIEHGHKPLYHTLHFFYKPESIDA